ncbi:hypothetical protein T07_8600, partial [Trichinella nelsoni]
LIQFFYELKITFALLHFENAQMQSIISEDGLRHHLSFYGALFVPGTHYIDVMRIRFFWWHSELKLTQWHSSLVLVWFHLRITLRQSSSAGARIDLSWLWIMSSHEARTDANQCSPGVSMAFSSRPSVPLLITYNGLRHQKICLVAADSTLKLRFLRLEAHLEWFPWNNNHGMFIKFFIKSSRERKVLVRSIKVNGQSNAELSGLKGDIVEV